MNANELYKHELELFDVDQMRWFIYEFTNKQKVPKGQEVIVDCDNDFCINPEHISLKANEDACRFDWWTHFDREDVEYVPEDVSP